MKIGLDYDGVIADTGAVKEAWIRKHLQRNIPSWKTDRASCVPLIGLEHYNQMSKEVYGKKYSAKALPVPGLEKALPVLAQKRRIYIITSRKRSNVAPARAWLKRHNFHRYITKVFFVEDTLSKEKLCRKLKIDVLVDDDARHLLVGVKGNKLLRILFKEGGAKKVKPHQKVKYARSWEEVLKLIFQGR